MSSILHKVCVVLYEPQDYVNIAATIRAMKNMGVSQLRLVRPCEYTDYKLAGIAHGTQDLIRKIVSYDTLEAAISDCVRVAGFTARKRAAKREVADVRKAVSRLATFAEDGMVALLFGREDHGLPNEALDKAHILATIPTTDHSSLNLAQAALLALYELHLVANDATRTLGLHKRKFPPADSEMYEHIFSDAHKALQKIEFFKTRYDEHIMRTFRSLIYRAEPDMREGALLRAMSIEVVRALDRMQGITHIKNPIKKKPTRITDEL